MSDSFDVSARVWPVASSSGDCRVIATDGLVVVHHGPRKASVLSGKLEVAYFMRQALEADSEEGAANDLIGAVASACRFAFDGPAVKPKAKEQSEAKDKPEAKGKPKDDMREWLNASLGHSVGSIVKSKDLRRAWHDHFHKKHGVGSYWSAYRFHARLREYGYKVERVCGSDGTGCYIMGVFMRNGSSPFNRGAVGRSSN